MDIIHRLFVILRVLWLRWLRPPPNLPLAHAERLHQIDVEHAALLAEFDQQLQVLRFKAYPEGPGKDALSADARESIEISLSGVMQIGPHLAYRSNEQRNRTA